MTQLHPAAEIYLQSIQRLLDVPKEDQARLLDRLSHAVSTYCEENPEASAEDITAVFGSPASCAAELMAECDPAEVSKVRRNKRRLLFAVIAVLAALLVAMVVFWFYSAKYQIRYVETHITEDAPNTGGLLS